MITIKKYFTICCFLALFFNQTQAQSFAIKITQVYPSGGAVYVNSYNLPGELDKAEVSLRNQYKGKNANYVMELTRPSGKETKIIQNIKWILVEDGKKKDVIGTIQPKPGAVNPQPIIIELYECDIRGGKIKTVWSKNYLYRYEFRKNGNVLFLSDYYHDLETCKKATESYFSSNVTIPKINNVFCEIEIKSGNFKVSNKKEHKDYIASLNKKDQRKETVSTPLNSTDTTQEKNLNIGNDIVKEAISDDIISKIKSISIDTIYNYDSIDRNLKTCQTIISINHGYLKENNADSKYCKNLIIEKAEAIAKIMNPKGKIKFDFKPEKNGDLNIDKLNTGIIKLISDNNKIKVSLDNMKNEMLKKELKQKNKAAKNKK